MKDKIERIIRESIEAKKRFLNKRVPEVEKAVKAIIDSLESGGKLIIFGNGGSAADSQHIAAELVGRFKSERRALPALALTTNTSTLTALANDYGYDVTYARQIEAFGKKGDVALAISTSGNARNVIEAAKAARKKEIYTIALTGRDGGKLRDHCDMSIIVDEQETARIQEVHILIGHLIAALVEASLKK